MSLILKYFQKKDQLTDENKEYQKTISSLFEWLINNDKVDDDKTSKFFPDRICTAKIIAKQDGIIAGIEEAAYLLKKFSTLLFKSFYKDGIKFKNKDVITEIQGRSHEILAYERTILNILQRMSGIATETSSLISLIRPISQIQIAATRKTPWMALDKKAVAVGGGLTHRLNLSDGILIKDNHLSFMSIEKALKISGKAVKTPRTVARRDSSEVEESGKLFEIEVETEKQAFVAIDTFQKLITHNLQPTTYNHLAILLDNFTPETAKTVIDHLKDKFDLSEVIFEASGGIDEKKIKSWAKTGVDIISLGCLTHSSRAINLSLEF